MFGSVIVRQDVRMCEEDLMPLYRYKLSSLCSWTKVFIEVPCHLCLPLLTGLAPYM